MKKLLKTVGVALLAGSVLTGCIGRFALTDKVYTWNKHVDNERWVNEGIFLVFVILPVYGLTLLADGVLFNSIEWWTGKNPVLATGEQREVHGADGSLAVMTLRADGVIAVQVTAADGVRTDFTMARTSINGVDAVTVYDRQGAVLGSTTAF